MPIYEYYCDDCEMTFTEIKHIADYKQPGYCPQCGTAGEKIISAPRLNIMRQEIRKAHETNERSAHEPKVAHKCGPGCHHHHHKTEETKPAMKQQLNKRPWMLGH